jgi:L-lactate dehydrogenase
LLLLLYADGRDGGDLELGLAEPGLSHAASPRSSMAANCGGQPCWVLIGCAGVLRCSAALRPPSAADDQQRAHRTSGQSDASRLLAGRKVISGRLRSLGRRGRRRDANRRKEGNGEGGRAGGATDRSDPQGRLRLLDTNAQVYADIVPKVVAAAPRAVLMVVTDPPDPLADLTRRLAGHDRVFSTGTLIDSLRFRVHLADRLRVRPRDVQAMVVGEHGTSEVLLWSSALVGGLPVLDLLGQSGESIERLKQQIEHDIRYANITIIEGTGASQYGIGAVSARLAEAVLRDERAVLPVAAYSPHYDVTLSLVSVLGAGGVQQMHEPAMTSDERAALERSAAALREAASRVLASGP